MEPHTPTSEPVDRDRLVDLIQYEYRSLVVRRLGVTAEWGVLDWTHNAACHTAGTVTEQVCLRCPVRAQCLAAAIASDDPAQWRGGVNRADREHLWTGLERTYREVRDFELLRLDLARLNHRDGPEPVRPMPTDDTAPQVKAARR